MVTHCENEKRPKTRLSTRRSRRGGRLSRKLFYHFGLSTENYKYIIIIIIAIMMYYKKLLKMLQSVIAETRVR